jgi:competence transcription factor ComK
MKKKNIFLILLVMLVTVSCQTIKNAVTGVKQETSDEFLVQKKHPLVLPPDFTELPVPFEESIKVTEVQIEDDIEKLLGIENNIKDTDNTSDSSSIENFVLKKIKEN